MSGFQFVYQLDDSRGERRLPIFYLQGRPHVRPGDEWIPVDEFERRVDALGSEPPLIFAPAIAETDVAVKDGRRIPVLGHLVDETGHTHETLVFDSTKGAVGLRAHHGVEPHIFLLAGSTWTGSEVGE